MQLEWKDLRCCSFQLLAAPAAPATSPINHFCCIWALHWRWNSNGATLIYHRAFRLPLLTRSSDVVEGSLGSTGDLGQGFSCLSLILAGPPPPGHPPPPPPPPPPPWSSSEEQASNKTSAATIVLITLTACVAWPK